MSKLKNNSDKNAGLRKKAEKKLNTQLERLKELSAKGAHDLAQELGTHQIELEMQIEELQRAQEELEASRSKYSDLYDFAPVGYLTFDAAGVVREANLTAAKMLGVERLYLLNKPFSSFLSREDNDAFRLHCAAILENRTKQTIEIRLKRRDKTEFFALFESVVVEDPGGNAAAIRTAVSDISERKRTEEALRRSEEKYRSLFDNMIDGFAYHRIVLDEQDKPVDYVFLEVNDSFERLTGLKRGDIVGKRVREALPGIEDDPADWIGIYGKVALTGQEMRFERYAAPLGKWYSIMVYSPLKEHFVTIFEDITDRKSAELKLQKENREIELASRVLRVFVEEAGDDMYDKALSIVLEGMQSEHGVFGYIDERGWLICPSLTKMLDQCEIEGKCIHYPPEKWKGLWARALREKRALYTNEPPWVPPGHPLIRNNLAVPILFQGSAIGLLNLANKETGYAEEDRELLEAVAGRVAPVLYAWIQKEMLESERQRAEEALRQSREDMSRAQTVGSIGSWRLDVRRNVLTWSDENHRIFGIPKGTPLTYETFLSTVHPDDREYVDTRWKAGLRGEPYDIEHRLVADGRIKWVREKAYLEFDQEGALLGGFGITQDITERKKAEDRIRGLVDSVQEERDKLSTLINSLPDEVWFSDAQKRLQLVNSAVISQFGNGLLDLKEVEKIAGMSEVYRADGTPRPVEEAPPLRALTGEIVKDAEELVRIPATGELRHRQVNAAPVRDVNGNIIGSIAVVRDITESKKAEEQLRRAADFDEAALKSLGEGLYTIDGKGLVTSMNPAAEKLFGWTFDELRGKKMHDMTHHHYRDGRPFPSSECAGFKVLTTGVPLTNHEDVFIHKDGTFFYVVYSIAPLRDAAGNITGLVVVFSDITDRKRAEEALQKAHAELELRVEERTRELTIANESARTERQRLFGVLETLPVYVILLTPDHKIPFANRYFQERFGASNGRRCFEYLFNRTEPCETCETYTVLKTNTPHHWYWTGPDGRDYDIYDYPFVDSDGATMILEMGIDITDQKKAQQALRETITELQEATHRAELTNSLLSLITQKNARREYLDATCDLLQTWSGVRHVGVRVTDPSRKIPFESCKGYDTDFLEQENDLSLAEDQCICTRIIAGAPEPSDLRSMTPKGSFYSGDALAFVDRLTENERSRYRGACMKHHYRSLAVIPILYRGNPAGAVHLADERPEMLSRTTIEFLEQLAQIIGEAVYRFGVEEERIRLTSALESSADGVVITNSKNGQIEYVNRAFEQITGYAKNEAIGSNLHLLDSGKHDEAFYRELRAALARDGVWRGILINRKKDGMLYYEECSFSPVLGSDSSIVNYVSVKRDVTEKLRLESIAESVTSMNNIGYIFAGVRHEIGNPINSAKMMLSVLQMKLETATREAIKNYVDRSLVEIGRVENLLRNLKNFNLYETPVLKDLHLPSFLREFRNLINEDLKQKGIAFNQNIADGAERARIDPRALQQVLINLVTNAADAVAGKKDPSIEIHVRKEPGLLHLEVTDNGAGLTEKQQQDLFKPFYTSKQHGTGLGLVIVKKLLTRMNCGISVTSVPGQGTVVDITVPEGGQ